VLFNAVLFNAVLFNTAAGERPAMDIR